MPSKIPVSLGAGEDEVPYVQPNLPAVPPSSQGEYKFSYSMTPEVECHYTHGSARIIFS